MSIGVWRADVQTEWPHHTANKMPYKLTNSIEKKTEYYLSYFKKSLTPKKEDIRRTKNKGDRKDTWRRWEHKKMHPVKWKGGKIKYKIWRIEKSCHPLSTTVYGMREKLLLGTI